MIEAIRVPVVDEYHDLAVRVIPGYSRRRAIDIRLQVLYPRVVLRRADTQVGVLSVRKTVSFGPFLVLWTHIPYFPPWSVIASRHREPDFRKTVV